MNNLLGKIMKKASYLVMAMIALSGGGLGVYGQKLVPLPIPANAPNEIEQFLSLPLEILPIPQKQRLAGWHAGEIQIHRGTFLWRKGKVRFRHTSDLGELQQYRLEFVVDGVRKSMRLSRTAEGWEVVPRPQPNPPNKAA